VSLATNSALDWGLKLPKFELKLKLKLIYDRHSVGQSVLVSSPIWDF
jgi:hypothetical protein